jgi:hypothetical protein
MVRSVSVHVSRFTFIQIRGAMLPLFSKLDIICTLVSGRGVEPGWAPSQDYFLQPDPLTAQPGHGRASRYANVPGKRFDLLGN